MASNSQTTLKVSESVWSASTSNPRKPESFSLFGDGSCGEPLMTQHLVLDFTPDQEVDNDYVQKKCCAFWEFIDKQPELQHMMVSPQPDSYRKNIETSVSSFKNEPTEIPEQIMHERTAVSMLEIVERKGLIDRTFEAKLPQSQCSLGSREYLENESKLPRGRNSTQKTVCRCSGSFCSICRQKEASPSSPRAADLCQRMQEWDAKHPKSMEPPGHPPALSHCVMQRKLLP